MRRPTIYSAILHIAVILFAWLGLPHFMSQPVVVDEPIPVDVVTIADKTNPPKTEPKPEQKPTPPKKAEQLPPAPPLPEPPKPPEPQKVEAPTPTPEPPKPTPPKPEPQVAAIPPQPEPQPTPKPQPEKKAEPQPQPVATPIVPVPPKAKPKPPPTTSLDSILKSVEKIKPQSQPDQAQKVVKEIAQSQPRVSSSLDNKVTISEIDAVRKQIERCWNVPAGAKDAKDLIVDIQLALNQDGTVRQATILDQGRMSTDSFYRAAAESAYRAIFLCQPLHLPPDKYSAWQNMILSFNPSQIL